MIWKWEVERESRKRKTPRFLAWGNSVVMMNRSTNKTRNSLEGGLRASFTCLWQHVTDIPDSRFYSLHTATTKLYLQKHFILLRNICSLPIINIKLFGFQDPPRPIDSIVIQVYFSTRYSYTFTFLCPGHLATSSVFHPPCSGPHRPGLSNRLE